MALKKENRDSEQLKQQLKKLGNHITVNQLILISRAGLEQTT